MSLRVAFVMPGVGQVERGAEAFVVELCAALAREGRAEVTLFCRGEAPVAHQRVAALARDRRWLRALYRSTRPGRKLLDTLFLDPLSLEWYTAALSALPRLWRGRFDVVVMEGGLVGAWVGRLLRRFRGSAFVDIAHGVDPKWEGAFARRRPDRAVVFTAAFAEVLRRLAPRTDIEVIPHGVDLELFRADVEPQDPGLPRPLVLTAGEVDRHKRIELAVEAVAGLDRGSLVVLGDGESAGRVDVLGRSLLGEERYLRTRVPRRELPSWYAAADCFTLPSKTESFGLVYLEALACGCPCVAPDDAVRREVVGEGGIFCDVTDRGAYSAALAEAVARDWGERPREQAERFPFAATVASYTALFEALSDGRR